MTEKIIFILLMVVSLILSIRSGNKWNIVLTLTFSLGFLIMWTKIEGSMLTGSIIITVATLIIMVYGFGNPNYTEKERWLAGSTGLIILLQLMSTIFHWQMYTIGRLLIILPLILYVILLIDKNRKRVINMGFIHLIMGFGLIRLLTFIRLIHRHGGFFWFQHG